MKFIAVGDQHFQVNNVTACKTLISKLTELVKKEKPDFVTLLGDLLHTHEKVHITPFKLATELIISLSKLTDVYLIIGNHDYCNNQQFLTDNHAFNSFKGLNNIIVCDHVIKRKVKGVTCVWVPYTPPERFEEALNTVPDWISANYIFAHQEFYGCQLNPVIKSVNGDIWPEEYPLVISGHIHDSQWLQKNIYYTGSCMQHGFGEKADKTILRVTDTSFETIDLGIKKKRIKTLTIDEVKDYRPNKKYDEKLVIRGSVEEIKIFRKGREFKKLQSLGLAVSFSPDEKHVDLVEKRGFLDILQDLVSKEDEYVKKSFKILVNSNE